MLIALVSHISRANCCWKSKWLSLLKKRETTLVISTQNWSILAKFAKKTPAKSAVFYWLFLGKVSPRNFPWNRPIFLRICPWKSFEIWLFPLKSSEIERFSGEFWLFSRENPTKLADFSGILTFFLRNRPIFPRICPWKSRANLLFFREISEALCCVLYAVHSPTQILPTVTCHEFSASPQISQQWFRVHCSVMYVFVHLTHLLSWVTGSSSGVLSITSKMALRTFLRYSATLATVGHTKLPPIL